MQLGIFRLWSGLSLNPMNSRPAGVLALVVQRQCAARLLRGGWALPLGPQVSRFYLSCCFGTQKGEQSTDHPSVFLTNPLEQAWSIANSASIKGAKIARAIARFGWIKKAKGKNAV